MLERVSFQIEYLETALDTTTWIIDSENQIYIISKIFAL